MEKIMPKIIILTSICLWGVLCKTRNPKIAIIGGGIGGTSSAYFLKELFGSETSIDLYEANEIGGRLATVTINNESFETGGAIIHPRNKYMLNFLNLLGQKKRQNTLFSKFGIYDGTEFLYAESNWEVMSMLKLLWRYGYGPIKLQSYIDDQLNKFSRIYTLQESRQCYVTVTDLLRAMSPSFVEGLTTSCKKGFTRDGFSDRLIDELVAATLSANYGQDTSVHAFVGMVSVAGASSGLWAVEGGNRKIPEGLLTESNANHIESNVAKVIFNPDSRDYTLEIVNETASNESEYNQTKYDIVILATPLTEDKSHIEFVNIPNLPSFNGEFHRTVSTIVTGKVDHTFFGFDSEDEMIDEVLVLNFDSFFHTLCRINPVSLKSQIIKSNVWKLFSRAPIDEEDLRKVFKEIDSFEVADWLAYPHYTTDARNDSFVLNENLYHVNAVEWGVSAMEMIAIGAKNVALLAHKRWNSIPLTDSRERFDDEL